MLNKISPKSNIRFKTESVFFFQLAVNVTYSTQNLSLTKWGQCRRKCSDHSTSKPQLHNGYILFWKLCLNICSLKWHKPSPSLVINLCPLELWQLLAEFGDGCMNLRMLILKSHRFSNLFQSKKVDGKNEIFKKLWIVLRRGMFSEFLVEYNTCLTEIKLKIYEGCSLFKTL